MKWSAMILACIMLVTVTVLYIEMAALEDQIVDKDDSPSASNNVVSCHV